MKNNVIKGTIVHSDGEMGISISNLKSMFLGIYHGISILYRNHFIEEFFVAIQSLYGKTNLERIGSLLSSLFQTSVKTAKQFKQDNANG